MVGTPPPSLPFRVMVSLGYITHGLLAEPLFVYAACFQRVWR